MKPTKNDSAIAGDEDYLNNISTHVAFSPPGPCSPLSLSPPLPSCCDKACRKELPRSHISVPHIFVITNWLSTWFATLCCWKIVMNINFIIFGTGHTERCDLHSVTICIQFAYRDNINIRCKLTYYSRGPPDIQIIKHAISSQAERIKVKAAIFCHFCKSYFSYKLLGNRQPCVE